MNRPNYNSAEFLMSAPSLSDLPSDGGIEVAYELPAEKSQRHGVLYKIVRIRLHHEEPAEGEPEVPSHCWAAFLKDTPDDHYAKTVLIFSWSAHANVPLLNALQETIPAARSGENRHDELKLASSNYIRDDLFPSRITLPSQPNDNEDPSVNAGNLLFTELNGLVLPIAHDGTMIPLKLIETETPHVYQCNASMILLALDFTRTHKEIVPYPADAIRFTKRYIDVNYLANDPWWIAYGPNINRGSWGIVVRNPEDGSRFIWPHTPREDTTPCPTPN